MENVRSVKPLPVESARTKSYVSGEKLSDRSVSLRPAFWSSGAAVSTGACPSERRVGRARSPCKAWSGETTRPGCSPLPIPDGSHERTRSSLRRACPERLATLRRPRSWSEPSAVEACAGGGPRAAIRPVFRCVPRYHPESQRCARNSAARSGLRARRETRHRGTRSRHRSR